MFSLNHERRLEMHSWLPLRKPLISVQNDRGSLVVKISDHGWLVTSSSPVPLKTRPVGERCSLNLSKDQTSTCRCGVIVRRRGASSGVIFFT
ncbi:hypothetical protein TNCV_2340891 [Trichonephila clavipes]|nr:hypothetical protein TNCV_2340891 [Trichonephila clavipes]